MQSKPKVFIHYSWDSDEHKTVVKNFVEKLRCDEIEIIFDQDNKSTPTGGLLHWMQRSVEESDLIIVICTQRYFEIYKNGSSDKGLGVQWEKRFIQNNIYTKQKDISHFFPVTVDGNYKNIPSDFSVNCHSYVKNNIEVIKNALLDKWKEIIADTTERENDLDKIVTYLISSTITPETLKSTAKPYLEPLYQRELASKTTLRDIVDYLDNHDKNPLYCVVKELFKNDDTFIEEWLKKNSHTSCHKEVIVEEEFEDRIVVDFEPVTSNRYDVFIRYFVNSAFQGNDEKVFEEISINEAFKQDFVSYLSSDIKNIENLDIFLPKELLLLDIKQWNSDKRNRLTKKYKVNIHIRERADLIEKYKKSFVEKWNLKINEFQGETLSIALKEMNSDEDEATKDTKEIGLWYLYTPIDTAYFYEDNMFTFISIRDGQAKIQWDDNKDTMQLQNLKEYIDHDDRKDITLIWDDPNIPLKPKEGVTQ